MSKESLKPQGDDEQELAAMLEYYAKQYAEVYFVRDLQTDLIIAAECYPAKPALPAVTRNGRRVNCIGYKDRLFASRERFDLTPGGKPMVGYESTSGNDTRIGKIEEGIVVKRKATMADAMGGFENIGGSSPFEQEQKRVQVRLAQASSHNEPDYELMTKDNGLTVERFETFAVERMK